MSKTTLPEDDFDDRPFLKRHPLMAAIGLGAVVTVAVIISKRQPEEKVKHSKEERLVSISMPPMPPPPPPPPPPKIEPPKVEQEVVKQDAPVENEPPPDSPPDAAPAAPPGAPSAPGGVLGPSGPRKGSGSIGGGRKRGKYDGFALATQKALISAISKNSSTKTTAMKCEAKIWADSSGRVTKATLVNVSGDSSAANSIDNSILNGFQLPEAPPSDMPMPITMRITIARPN